MGAWYHSSAAVGRMWRPRRNFRLEAQDAGPGDPLVWLVYDLNVSQLDKPPRFVSDATKLSCHGVEKDWSNYFMVLQPLLTQAHGKTHPYKNHSPHQLSWVSRDTQSFFLDVEIPLVSPPPRLTLCYSGCRTVGGGTFSWKRDNLGECFGFFHKREDRFNTPVSSSCLLNQVSLR